MMPTPSAHGSRAAVVGAGTMGVGIVYSLARAGATTWVVEPARERAEQMTREVDDYITAGIERGKLDAAGGRAIVSAIHRVSAVDELPTGLDLIIESVPERLALKHEVLRAAEARSPRLLATNTSALSIDELATELARPERFLGMHFFNPVPSLALVEIVRGARTDDAAVTAALDIVAAIGKQPAIVNDSPGFATSRLDLCLALEAMRMVEEGVAEPEHIDRAVRLAYRHPVGPLELSDIVGLDVRLDIAEGLATALGPRFAPPALLVDKVARGELGRKSGQGFYIWAQGAPLTTADR